MVIFDVTFACAPKAAGSADSAFTFPMALSASAVFFISLATMYTPNQGAACAGAATAASRYLASATSNCLARYAALPASSAFIAANGSCGPLAPPDGDAPAFGGVPRSWRPDVSDLPQATSVTITSTDALALAKREMRDMRDMRDMQDVGRMLRGGARD